MRSKKGNTQRAYAVIKLFSEGQYVQTKSTNFMRITENNNLEYCTYGPGYRATLSFQNYLIDLSH